MKNIKLSTQFYVIFTVVILFTSLFFTLGMNYVFEDFQLEQNKQQLQSYAETVLDAYLLEGLDSPFLANSYNGYLIVKEDEVVETFQFELLESIYTPQMLYRQLRYWIGDFKEETLGEQSYYYAIERTSNITVIAFTDTSYLENLGDSFNVILRISFISLVLLGNTTILIWSRIIVDRIRQLQGEVTKLSLNNYHVPIEVEGSDEITELAKRIEKMRQEIESNEQTKQAMIQNISHDFKTPIAVIQSYAEAIRDGVSEVDEADVIIKQVDVLNHKVKQLIELTKLEHAVTQQETTSVRIKEVIEHIVDQQKYRTHLTFNMKLDQSSFEGIYDHFYSAFSNIIDNMLRYARTKIDIELKEQVLTFYNDGPGISDDLIDRIFKPYEKGPNGQFGLGLSIVKRTMDLFHLSIEITNVKQGVMFTIKPLESK
jgi:two-component system, OmpR family, sensor histidine kinase CssS